MTYASFFIIFKKCSKGIIVEINEKLKIELKL